jgi:hypothetical protein
MFYEDYSAFNLFRFQDVFLAPICFFIILFFIRLKYLSYKKNPVASYILPAFLLRIIAACLYALLINYYYGFGDSHNYYQGTLDLHRAVSQDVSFWYDIYSKWKLEPTDRIYPYFAFDGTFSTQFYMQEVRTYNVSRLALPLSILFNKSFLCISFCISYLSFLGSWKLFMLFYEQFSHLHRKIAIATLFLPSLLFWSTSLLKDPFCFAALGYLSYSLYAIFIKRAFSFIDILSVFISSFILINLKPYILISLVAVFSLWLFLRYRSKIKDNLLRRLSTGVFLFVSLTLGLLLTSFFSGLDEKNQYQTEKLVSTINSNQSAFENIKGEGSGSNFKAYEASSLAGLILGFPVGVFNTYFRPFFWDVRSPIALLSALEAFGFLALTFYCIRKIGFKSFLQTVISDPLIAFCLGYAMLFGGVIGLTTTNFGALTRYKIPSIPFYAMGIILVMDKFPYFSKKYIFSKRFF